MTALLTELLAARASPPRLHSTVTILVNGDQERISSCRVSHLFRANSLHSAGFIDVTDR